MSIKTITIAVELAYYGKLTPIDGARTTSPVQIAANDTTQISAAQFQIPNVQIISGMLSMYVDNGGNASPLTFQFASGQVLQFPAQSQGYLSVLQPNPVNFSVTNPNATIATVQVLNFIPPSIIWSATAL